MITQMSGMLNHSWRYCHRSGVSHFLSKSSIQLSNKHLYFGNIKDIDGIDIKLSGVAGIEKFQNMSEEEHFRL